ncbi:MAG: SDR family NAD(P)-dependent oxidoreductase [Methanoregula sp.]
MKLKGNTILITGGATGIGLALAEAFINAGNEVIVCARTEANLKKAKKKLPTIHIRRCDVSKETERTALYDWATSTFPNLNVLINNAGIQRMINFCKGTEDLLRYRQEDGDDEIEINLKSLIYMTALFTPHLLKQKEAAIVNVSSGTAFIPQPSPITTVLPVYVATKVAIHSFSQSLRQQLKDTPVKVFELVPPMMDTNLDKGARKARGETYFGPPAAEIAAPAMKALENDEYEIRVQDPNFPNIVKTKISPGIIE